MAQSKTNKPKQPQRSPAQKRKDRRRERRDARDYERLYLKYGPNAARAESQMKPKQWKRTKQTAKRRGFALDSFLDPNVPKPLKQRTRNYLEYQARRQVNQAYKPVLTGLSQQARRIKALDEKRKTDAAHYQQWVADQLHSLDQNNARVESALIAHGSQVRTDRDAALQERQAAAVDTSQDAAAGITSQRSDSTALDFGAETAKALANLDNSRLAMDEAIGRGRDRSAAASANTIALGAAAEAKRVADTWTALMDVADDKQKVKLQRAADRAKEVARLLENETGKAQTNREFDAAVSKLNLDRAELRQDAKQFAQTLAANRLKDWRNYQLGKARIDESKRATNLLNAYRKNQISLGQSNLELGWWKAKHPNKGKGKGGSQGTQTERMRNKNEDNFSTAYAQLATGTLPVKGKNGKVTEVPMNAQRARANRNKVINSLVAAGFGRGTALAAWRAFVAKNGNDYGNWKKWYRAGSGPSGGGNRNGPAGAVQDVADMFPGE